MIKIIYCVLILLATYSQANESNDIKENFPVAEPSQELDDYINKILKQEKQEKSRPVKEHPETINNFNNISFTVIDKVTAKKADFTTKLITTSNYKKLNIIPYACIKDADSKPEGYKALFYVYERLLDDNQTIIFKGWLFNKAKSISSVEHPLYDILLKECH